MKGCYRQLVALRILLAVVGLETSSLAPSPPTMQVSVTGTKQLKLGGVLGMRPPSVTITDAANTLLPAHIQSSTDVQPLPSPSQPPVAMECTQSEGLDIASHDPNPVSAHFL